MQLFHRVAQLLMGAWVGGVACVAFVVAPRIFEVMRDKPISNHLDAQRQGEVAGELLAPVFASVDKFGIVASVVFLIAAWGVRGRSILAGVLAVCAAANLFLVAPQVEARGEGFETWHLIATGLWVVILVGGTVLALVGPDRAPPRAK